MLLGELHRIGFVHFAVRLTRVLFRVAAFCSSRKAIDRVFLYGLKFLSLNLEAAG